MMNVIKNKRIKIVMMDHESSLINDIMKWKM